MFGTLWCSDHVFLVLEGLWDGTNQVWHLQPQNWHHCWLASPWSPYEQNLERVEHKVDNKLLRDDVDLASKLPNQPQWLLPEQNNLSGHNPGRSVGQANGQQRQHSSYRYSRLVPAERLGRHAGILGRPCRKREEHCGRMDEVGGPGCAQ